MPTSGPNELSWSEWELQQLREQKRKAEECVLELAKREALLMNRIETLRQQAEQREPKQI